MKKCPVGFIPELGRSLDSWCYHPMAIVGPALKAEKGFGLVFWYRKKSEIGKICPTPQILSREKRGLDIWGLQPRKQRRI